MPVTSARVGVAGRKGEDETTKETPLDRSTDVVLSIENLTKTYGRGPETVTAVDDVALEIQRGTVVGLLGPNGAGKTTMIKLLLGLVYPDEGEISVDGTDPIASPRDAYRSVSAMLEGARNVYWRLSVRENLRFFARLADQSADPARIDALIEGVGLAEKADTTVNDLSRGMKQKASLACTLARETPIALLDEPTLGLDVESSRELRTQLRHLVETESRTILLSSHDMDVIEDVCDRVLIMNEGRIIADDTVERLIDVFRTQSYRVTVDGDLPTTTRRQLDEGFNVTDWHEQDGRQTFKANHVRGDAFYDLMDLVRESGSRLSTVDSVEPTLEDVFLELTDDGEQ